MNLKLNPDDCGTLPCRSTLLYSLLLAGVTSTSTLCILGADYCLETKPAQAAPTIVADAEAPTAAPSNHSTTAVQPISDRHWNQDFAALLDQATQQSHTDLKASLVAPDVYPEPDRAATAEAVSPAASSGTARSLPRFSPSSVAPSANYNFSTLHASEVSVTHLSLNTAAETQATPAGELAQASDSPTGIQSSDANSTPAQTEQIRQTEQTETVRSPDSQSNSANPPQNQNAGTLLGRPFIHLQGAYVLQGDESSARLRATGTYILNPNVMFGATVDLSTGNAFVEQNHDGINLDELYVTLSPTTSSNLRFTIGWMDLTSYFDRNSFAKDVVTQFFNPVFQTNPALVASGITASRLGALVNWDVLDNLNLKAAAFSSDRDLGNFAIDAFAGEVGVRFGNLIVRGTYATDKDAGADSGFQEIFQFPRDGGRRYGLTAGDREESYGINSEYYIPELKLGLFGRYGHYQNLALDRGGDTFSFGFNLLDLFLPDDRLGLGYGRALSNDSLRRERGDTTPDVLELFYDVRITPNLRAGATLQFRDQFSETIAGFRIRADFDVK